MAKLVRAVDHALQAVLKDCSDAKFAQSFPQLARDNPVALAQARQDVVAQFQASVMSSFDKLVSDRQIDARLNDLDVLIEAARQRPAASYSGPPPAPQDIATVRRYNAKLLERKRLLDKLTAISADNDVQIRRVKLKQDHLRRMMAHLREKRAAVLPAQQPLSFDADNRLL